MQLSAPQPRKYRVLKETIDRVFAKALKLQKRNQLDV